jgi:hypothetical protein
MINVINEKTLTLAKNPNSEFSIFLRDWYRRGFKLFMGKRTWSTLQLLE